MGLDCLETIHFLRDEPVERSRPFPLANHWSEGGLWLRTVDYYPHRPKGVTAMPRLNPCRARGFTLIEVMIVVAIVGILAAIALPSYFEYIQRGKLIDATVKLGDFRAQMERYFLDNRTYNNAGACGVPDPTPGTSDPFAITCVLGANPATQYDVTATGRPAYGMSASFKYTVNQANEKTSLGPTGWTGATTCWAVRKDGSCQ